MTKRPLTSTEYTILSIDAERGITYSSFEDFWERRMEPLQFIPPDAKGSLARVRQLIKDHAKEQWDLFEMHQRQGLLVLQPMPLQSTGNS